MCAHGVLLLHNGLTRHQSTIVRGYQRVKRQPADFLECGRFQSAERTIAPSSPAYCKCKKQVLLSGFTPVKFSVKGSNPTFLQLMGDVHVDINGKVAVVTGAASGIGRAVAEALAKRDIRAIALVDRTTAVEELACKIAGLNGGGVGVQAMVGDVTDEAFRRTVFDRATAAWGVPRICVPAAGVVHDMLATRVDKATGRAALYPLEQFRRVLEVNLVAPTYWALEMIGRIAEDRFAKKLNRWEPEEHVQGTVIFIGSVSSRGTGARWPMRPRRRAWRASPPRSPRRPCTTECDAA